MFSGVSLDNLSTPKPPDYVPPFTIFAPWCFRSLQMQPEDTFQRGRLYALRLLCMATGKQTAVVLCFHDSAFFSRVVSIFYLFDYYSSTS